MECNSSLTLGHLFFFPPFTLCKKEKGNRRVTEQFPHVLGYEMLSTFRDDHMTHGSPLHNGMTTLFALFGEATNLCGGSCSIARSQASWNKVSHSSL